MSKVFDSSLRLVSMLGFLTIVVILGLVLDYLHIIRRPVRLGLGIAALGIVAGIGLTLSAVLPDNQVFGTVFTAANTSQKQVALTFDDGPYPPYTGQVLDILKAENVRATFFLIGQNVDAHPELAARIHAEGHQIGNHTYHHIDLLKADRLRIADELDRTSNAIYAATGQYPAIVRPPHGFRDPVVLEIMAERGLKVVEWSVASRDWVNPGVDAIVQTTLAKVQNGSIVLLHDGDGVAAAASRQQTVDATRKLIKELRAQGYIFVTVDEILHRPEERKP